MILEEIELDIATEKIRHNNSSIWPIIKSYLVGAFEESKIIKDATPSTLKILIRNLVPDLLSLRNINKSKNWVFTNSERRYYVNEASFDRVTTGLLNYLEDYLLFENPIPQGATKRGKLQKGEHPMGMSWIFLIQFLLLKFSRKPIIENLDVLESYLNKDLSIIEKIYHRICAGEKVYNFLIRLYKPKTIFVVCYYSNFELIKAAKKHNVPIVELQHGLVSKGHRAYYYKKQQNNNYLPDFFFSYGSYSSKIIASGNVVKADNILDYGYTFLELVGKELSISLPLEIIKSKFKTTICITGQLEMTNIPLLEMIRAVCIDFPDTCFIYKPRYYDKSIIFLEKANFIQLENVNTYELLKYCDYHITVYSTCALESLALGTPNISIDINGYYTKYLKNMIETNPYNYVVNSGEELTKVLRELDEKLIIQKEVRNSINHIFSNMVTSKTFFNFFHKIVKEKPNH